MRRPPICIRRGTIQRVKGLERQMPRVLEDPSCLSRGPRSVLLRNNRHPKRLLACPGAMHQWYPPFLEERACLHRSPRSLVPMDIQETYLPLQGPSISGANRYARNPLPCPSTHVPTPFLVPCPMSLSLPLPLSFPSGPLDLGTHERLRSLASCQRSLDTWSPTALRGLPHPPFPVRHGFR